MRPHYDYQVPKTQLCEIGHSKQLMKVEDDIILIYLLSSIIVLLR